MLHWSKYNVEFDMNEKHYVYNTLSSRYVKGNYNLEDDTIIEDLCPDMQDMLLKKGIIVEEEENIERIMESYKGEKLKLIILASMDCNFRCKYCYEKYINDAIDQEFVTSIEKFINHYMEKYQSLFVEWFGGEPLLVKERVIQCSSIFQKKCFKSKKPFLAAMTTNGYMLDYETFERLRKVNVLFYQITIDGMKETHDYYRALKNGQGTFDVIIKNLLDIKNNVSKSAYFRILIRNNITNINQESCEKFKEFFLEHFGGDKRFVLEQFPVQNWGGEAIKQINAQLLNIKKEELNGSMVNIFESLESRTCICANKNGYVVDPECNVYKCSHISEKKAKIGKITKQGELLINDSFNDNWPSYIIDQSCKNCNFLPMCTVRCPFDRKIKPYNMCNVLQKELIKNQFMQNIR